MIFYLHLILFTIFVLPYVTAKIINMMNRIKEVLDEKGIKQTWLAEKLGKSFNITNSYVCNRRQPTLEILYKIADILQVDVKELLVSNQKQDS